MTQLSWAVNEQKHFLAKGRTLQPLESSIWVEFSAQSKSSTSSTGLLPRRSPLRLELRFTGLQTMQNIRAASTLRKV